MRGFGDKPGGEGVGGLPEPGEAGVGEWQPLIERQASDGLEGVLPFFCFTLLPVLLPALVRRPEIQRPCELLHWL